MSEISRCFSCGSFVRQGDRFCWACGQDQELPEDLKTTAAESHDLSREDWLSLRRAYLLRRRGELGEAELLLRQVLDGQPDHVPTLTLLAEVLRERGDVVAAVEAADRASQAARNGGARFPGSLQRAREERADIEESVIQELIGMESAEAVSPLGVFLSPGRVWYRSGSFFVLLAGLGAVALFLAVTAVLHARLVGCLWLAGSLLAGGWAYHDAESRRRSSLFWGPLVLCTGPFGLAIYLLSR